MNLIHMQITTLIENHVELRSLYAEHGLSILIDTGTKKILFDTGQSDKFLFNAMKLGIDIMDIDYVVLSHGHYDHTGGLSAFLNLNKKAIVFCKKEIFISKYDHTNNFIGIVWQDNLFQDRFTFINSITELDDNLFIIPDVIIHHPIDTHFENLRVRIDDSLVADEMQDELFIVIRYEDKINIITACSHRGISNICETANDIFKLPFNLIVGGFHLKNSSQKQYKFIVDYINKLSPLAVGTCHCTGVEKFGSMQKDIKCPVFYNYTGRHIHF
jgi:7,8-dihydropterin-6-yl-methyl-4-(beta-D-ribofuranosyl)aminobenzene 5'-phosphate synthase